MQQAVEACMTYTIIIIVFCYRLFLDNWRSRWRSTIAAAMLHTSGRLQNEQLDQVTVFQSNTNTYSPHSFLHYDANSFYHVTILYQLIYRSYPHSSIVRITPLYIYFIPLRNNHNDDGPPYKILKTTVIRWLLKHSCKFGDLTLTKIKIQAAWCVSFSSGILYFYVIFLYLLASCKDENVKTAILPWLP